MCRTLEDSSITPPTTPGRMVRQVITVDRTVSLCCANVFPLKIMTQLSVVDHDEAVRSAQENGSGDSSLFTSALGFLNNNKVIRIVQPLGLS